MRPGSDGYRWPGIVRHWVLAVLLIGLFALGLWMTSLDYYHPWYRRGPELHRDLGIVAGLLALWRLAWRFAGQAPAPLPQVRPWERRTGLGVHWLLSLLPVPLVVSGYLISTAEGQPLQVFGWFEIPALVQDIDQLADKAGAVHWYLALGLVILAALHALAALKHHFADHDDTLRRMLRPVVRAPETSSNPQEK